MRFLHLCLLVSVLLMMVGGAQAQETESVIAPNIFLRGLHLPQGVRYTATFIPSVDQALRNISVEITLPPEAQLIEMLVSQQVDFDVVRMNREGALTLIWQIARVPTETPLDAFAFTVVEPLTSDVEFYMEWKDANGTQLFENFLEVPPVTVALETEGALTVAPGAFQPVGQTGVQVALPDDMEPLTLIFHVLPVDFNPPAEYGDIW